MNALLKFVLVVIVGPVAMGLLYFTVMKPAVNNATRELTNNMQRPPTTVAERREALQADATQRAAEAKRAQIEAQAAQARRDIETARFEQQEAARKEAAWKAFFKPKKVCYNPQDWDTQVECGNAHIRAKREFEERWARGGIL